MRQDITTQTSATGTASPVPVAEASGILKRYGATTALADGQITIREGETHALVGRNGAGKSTLVSILTGLQAPDAGRVRFGGVPAPSVADPDAWRSRVACVYQKSTIIPTLSVAENLFLNRQSVGGPIRWGAIRAQAEELLAPYDVNVDPARPAGDLNVEQRQMVEIARALSFGARFIILDEPTAQLDGAAIERLFVRMRELQGSGVTFMFISHHLQEIYEVCDQVTVFRDARHVLSAPVAQVSQQALVEAMTGDAVSTSQTSSRPTVAVDAPVALSARSLTLDGEFDDVDLTVHAGEIVGLAGIGGSGKVSVAQCLVGLTAATSGQVTVAGRVTTRGSVPSALAAGLGFVPEDRHKEGLVPLLSVAENSTMTMSDRLGPAGLILPRRRKALAEKQIRDFDIKTDSPAVPVSGLSGGNAQKVVMARALARDPRALVLISPTAGVDVRSKQSLLDGVDDAARGGTGVLVVSDELDDLRVCDRVTVMFQGGVRSEHPAGWTDAQMVAAMEGVQTANESDAEHATDPDATAVTPNSTIEQHPEGNRT